MNVPDLEKIKKLMAEVEVMRKGRNLGDIPLNDPYWTSVHKLNVLTQASKEKSNVDAS